MPTASPAGSSTQGRGGADEGESCCPLAGVVTMDQIVIDCGPVGGRHRWRSVTRWCCSVRRGTRRSPSTEWADLLGTISYEVLCDIGPRVPRLLVGDRATHRPEPA